MNCPTCDSDTIVLRADGAQRRRQCTNTACNNRFTTIEVLKDDHDRLQDAVEQVRQVAERIKVEA